MALHDSLVSRRSFIMGAAAAVAAVGAGSMLAGCGSGSSGGSSSAASSSAASSASSPVAAGVTTGIEVNADTMEELNTVLLGKDAKIAAIIVALQRGYYDDENLTVNTQVVSGGFPEAMPMLSDGTVDVLPFGSIPTCTYVAQGDDLVIFGGTVTNGSEALKRADDDSTYQKAEDFKGKKIACFRMETGHMVTKSWLRSEGLTIGDKPEDVDSGAADVAFILLEQMAAEASAVENGEVDLCFVNSGQGYQFAYNNENLEVAFQPQDLVGHEFPCCRQSTNRAAFEEKKSALVKFEIANVRAMHDIANDKEGVVADIVAYSGQPEEFCEAIAYGLSDYDAAMTFEMDPRTDDVKAFYADMIANGDIDSDENTIVEHLDSRIYLTALQTLIERGENVDFYEGLLGKYEKNNTLGV